MTTASFTTRNCTFRQLMELGTSYQVPPLQRGFSWTENEWEELWLDIEELFQQQNACASTTAGASRDAREDGEETAETSSRFMGFLTLQRLGRGHFALLDGQQRLTTISILVLAAINCLQDLQKEGCDPARNAIREEILRNVYIGNCDARTLQVTPKLTLNHAEDAYFQNTLVALHNLPESRRDASVPLPGKAFCWFRERIKAACGQGAESGSRISSLVEVAASSLFFTVFTTDTADTAFMLLEHLHPCGPHHEITDFLKNQLLSCSGQPHNPALVASLDKRWSRMLAALGKESFPEFLRIVWNARHGFVRRKALFKALYTTICEQSAASRLLDELEHAAPTYAALRTPSHAQWNACERSALEILKGLDVSTPLSLLLTCHETFFARERHVFATLLHATAVTTLRTVLAAAMSSNELEKAYNAISLKIFSGECSSEKEILKELNVLYPDDACFVSSLRRTSFSLSERKDRNIVRFLLLALEQHLSVRSHDICNEDCKIEYILPEHPSRNWKTAEARELREKAFCLGNLTLLEAGRSSSQESDACENKKALYSQSSFQMTRELVTTYSQWTPEALEDRQRKMTECAAEIWKVQF